MAHCTFPLCDRSPRWIPIRGVPQLYCDEHKSWYQHELFRLASATELDNTVEEYHVSVLSEQGPEKINIQPLIEKAMELGRTGRAFCDLRTSPQKERTIVLVVRKADPDVSEPDPKDLEIQRLQRSVTAISELVAERDRTLADLAKKADTLLGRYKVQKARLSYLERQLADSRWEPDTLPTLNDFLFEDKATSE